jgi:hypothetical protein
MAVAKGGFIFNEAAVNQLQISECKDSEFAFLTGGRKLQKGCFYVVFPQYTFDKAVMGNNSATIVAWEITLRGVVNCIDMSVNQFRRSFFQEGGDMPDIDVVKNDDGAIRGSVSLSAHNLDGVFPLRGVITPDGKKAKAVTECFICAVLDDKTYWEPTLKRDKKNSSIWNYETYSVQVGKGKATKNVTKVKATSKAYPFIKQIEIDQLVEAINKSGLATIAKEDLVDLMTAPAVYDKLAYKG